MSQSVKSNPNTEQTLHNKGIGATSIEEVPSVSTLPDARDQSPGVQHPDISPGERLLGALWRSPDRCHQLGTLERHTKKFKNVPVAGVDDAVAQALQLSRAGLEVYFACVEYRTPDSREATNAAGGYGFWADIDCGKGKGYPTVDDAEEALSQFCSDAGLPEPTHIVHSGGGLHVYWVLDGAIHRDTWKTFARMLKALTKACGFRADDSRTADIASVLRVPGTLNHKFSPPRPVSLLHASGVYIERSVMLDAIAAAHRRMCSAPTPTPYCAPYAAVATASTHAYGVPDLARLASALATLDPDCDEETWKLRRLAPLALVARKHPEYSIELYELARSWSSGELRGIPSRAWMTPGGNGRTGKEVFDSVWDRFLTTHYAGTPVTIGTIYHDAKQAGWDPDEFQVINDGEDA